MEFWKSDEKQNSSLRSRPTIRKSKSPVISNQLHRNYFHASFLHPSEVKKKLFNIRTNRRKNTCYHTCFRHSSQIPTFILFPSNCIYPCSSPERNEKQTKLDLHSSHINLVGIERANRWIWVTANFRGGALLAGRWRDVTRFERGVRLCERGRNQ